MTFVSPRMQLAVKGSQVNKIGKGCCVYLLPIICLFVKEWTFLETRCHGALHGFSLAAS